MDKWLDPFHDGPQIGPRVQDDRSSSVPVGAFNVTQQQGLALKSSYPNTPVIFGSRNQAGLLENLKDHQSGSIWGLTRGELLDKVCFRFRFQGQLPHFSLDHIQKVGCPKPNDFHHCSFLIQICSGWWFGTFFFFPYIEKSNANWLIFFRGVETTNQCLKCFKFWTQSPGTSIKKHQNFLRGCRFVARVNSVPAAIEPSLCFGRVPRETTCD